MKMEPQQASFLLQVLMASLKNEQRVTKSVIQAIPPDKGSYRPDPFAKSAMELAWHIASAEHLFLSSVAAGAFDLTPRPRPESIQNSADVAKWYDENFTQDFAKLGAMSGEQLAKVMDFRGLFQLPAVMFVQFDLTHIIHHRGQLSTYLRPMGSKVPPIYGESYDSAEAKKAATAQAQT
jgi:uncharacterized damage-inducible protein DinB